jgi:eukaryotic translation initiation factor 2C
LQNIQLRYPNLPCVKVRGNKTSYFPIELCHIQPDQRVGITKQGKLAEEMIKVCALDPFARFQELKKLAADCRVFTGDNNKFLAKLGIELLQKPMELPGRMLPPPDVLFANNVTERVNAQGGFRAANQQRKQHQFVRGATLTKWWLVLVAGCMPINQAKNFVSAYKNMALAVGMKMAMCQMPAQIEETSEAVKQVMEKVKQMGSQFVMFITPDQTNLHDMIKRHEQAMCVVTQHVLCSTALNASEPRGNLTLYNILLKTNMKLGGINYDLDYSRLNIENKAEWAAHGRLFMGLDVNHPPPMDKSQRRKGAVEKQPSVMGFCSNAGQHPLHFIGDYEYCATREEIKQSHHSNGLQRQATNALTAYLHFNNKKYPKEIWMYRDGVSEGQYQHVLDFEVSQLRAAIKATLPKGVPIPKLVYMIVTKRHNCRIVPMLDNLKALQENRAKA